MRGIPRFVLWLAPLALISCAIVYEANSRARAPAPEPPRPTVNHAAHLGKDLLCIDCHDPDETGDPKIPVVATCFDCHDKDLSQENDRVNAYFDAIRKADGTYEFEKFDYMPGLIMDHKTHAGKDVECASCHGEPSAAAFEKPAPLALMTRCQACHTERNAPKECATCHEDQRADRKPASHDESFRANHGKIAPAGWREGKGESCAICHEVPQTCNACHAKTKPASHAEARWGSTHGRMAPEGWQDGMGGSCATCHEVPQFCSACHTGTKPASHREAGWRLQHGRGDSDALDGPFKTVSCALCHEEQACQRCHAVEQPRNHSESFKRRLHGVAAQIERQSCTTCHKQDTCIRCHETTRPLTHRGNFSTGQQSHCLGCHTPLASTTCYTCHKQVLGHLGQTPLPVDANHIGASDPADCETCHVTLPHLNDGGRCRRCHK